MGKTHLSGLEIGDPAFGVTGIWAAVPQAFRLKFTALNAGQKIPLPDGALITQVRVVDGAGALVVATVAIGTSMNGSEIFTGASTAGAALAVEKLAPAGSAWVMVTAGTVPLTVFITFIPG